MPLREGRLYQIDTRLRPSGNQGALVIGAEGFTRYHVGEALPGGEGRDGEGGPVRSQLWERQALLRARLAAGDAPLFVRAQREVLVPSLFRGVDGGLRAALAGELWAMRERIEREIAAESADRYNSKLGRGGLIDVEFAVQFLQLVHGRSHPEVRGAHTTTLLAALRDGSLLAPDEFGPLDRGWRFLRRLESRLRLERDRAIDHLPTSGRDLELLARRLGYGGPRAGEVLLSDYARATAGVRAALLSVLGLQGASPAPRGEPAGGAA
jgi:glutamate-ammonia-ligase adenylyltransferase